MSFNRLWDHVVSHTDIELYEKLGFGKEGGFGKRPAVVVIDVQRRTVGPEYVANCGPQAQRAVPKIGLVVDAARRASVPVIFAYVAPKTENDSSRFATKFAILQKVNDEGYDFVDELQPGPTDILLPKRHPSVFFGTALTSYLIDRSVDTLIVMGATTSGCVRATAVDAFAYGYRVIVPHDAVFDRVHTSHAVNLFDIDSKYGDVLDSSIVVDFLHEFAQEQRK